MVFTAFIKTLALFGERKFRALIWYSIGATIAALIALFYGLQLGLQMLIQLADYYNAQWFAAGSESWLHTALVFISTSGLLVALAFIMPTMLMVLAGFFTDAVSEIVEQQPNAKLRIAKPLGYGMLIKITLKFIGIYVLCSALFMVLFPFPFINIIVPFAITSFIMAQEYFSFAALRVMDKTELKMLMKRHKLALLGAGVIIHIIALTPFLNMLTPLIATGLAANMAQEAG